ncbi:MAG: ribokinase [Anaerolineaceae bacterium]
MDIVVIGSLNMDLVVRIDRMPLISETVRGGDLITIPGGKGANQAAAAALLDSTVSMVGRVGNDLYGSLIVNNLQKIGIDTSGVFIDPLVSTGTAMVFVTPRGENCIVISPGANGRVEKKDINENINKIADAKVLLLQLEIPTPTVLCAIEIAKQFGVLTILNPAPAAKLPKNIYKMIDILVPNEIEASLLTGIEVHDLGSASKAAQQLISLGIKKVILTLGKKGSLLVTKGNCIHIPAYEVEAVDTTGAGDSFIGGLATSITKGFSLEDAAHYASFVGALTVTRRGAQISFPTSEEVNKVYLDEKNNR